MKWPDNLSPKELAAYKAQLLSCTRVLDSIDGRPLRQNKLVFRCEYPGCRLRQIDGNKLQRCSGCQRSHYCSRECQVKDWPKHKKLCFSGVTAMKLFKSFRASPWITILLQMLCAVELKLKPNSDTRKLYKLGVRLLMLPDKVTRGIDPGDLLNPELKGNHKDGKGLVGGTGFLLVNNAFDVSNAPVDGVPTMAFEEARKQYDDAGRRDCLIVIVFFNFYKGLNYIEPIAISAEALRDVEIGLENPSKTQFWKAMSGPNVPLTTKNILTALNEYIGFDKDNLLKLRGKMTERDVDILQELEGACTHRHH